MRDRIFDFELGQTLFYGTKEVLLLDMKPLLFYAKIKYKDSNEIAKVNIRALTPNRHVGRTISLGVFSGGVK